MKLTAFSSLKFMIKINFYDRGRNLIWAIVVLAVIGLITGGLYYFSKQIPEKADKCLRIFGSGDPSKTLKIFVVPINYPSDKLRYDKPYNLDDFSLNFENDAYRFLFSNSEELGYGLLTVEPFSSHLDKISVFILPEECQFQCINDATPDYPSFFNEKLKECKYFEKDYLTNPKSYVVAITGEKETPENLCLECGGGPLVACANREFFIGYEETVTTFRHELGHQFGLGDIYGPAHYNGHIVQYFYSHGGYDDFWKFYKDIRIEGIEVPNCDFEAGCPKWCSGKPVEKPITPCSQYKSERECNAHWEGKDCFWAPTPHPYFKEQCIRATSFPINWQEFNSGTSCIEGAGCYYGCLGYGEQGHGWRSHFTGDLAAQWIDSRGRKHGFDPVSGRFLREILECCFPKDCGNYNYQKCSDFVKKYSASHPHKYLFPFRHSSCNICLE